MAHNNRKTGAHGVTIAASATPQPDVQAQLAQAIEADAQTETAPDGLSEAVELADSQPDTPATVEPSPEPDTPALLAQALALISNLTNKVNTLEVEMQGKAKVEPAKPANGTALIPQAQFGTLARRRGGPASAREVASFTSKRHIGLVAQVAPNHYLDMANENKADVAHMVIKLLVAHNPKGNRQGPAAWRFACYRNGQTVAQFIEACAKRSGANGTAYNCLRDLAYDSNRLFIALLPPGSKVDASMPAPEVQVARPFATPVASADVSRTLQMLRASILGQ